MQEKHIYEYACIRVVPQVVREEFLNVGVILYCKRKQFLRVKYHLDAGRLQAFSPQLNPDQVAQYLRAWDWICQGSPEGGAIARMDAPSRFRWLTAPRSTIIQCSKVHPGKGCDPETVLERLFDQYVNL